MSTAMRQEAREYRPPEMRSANDVKNGIAQPGDIVPIIQKPGGIRKFIVSRLTSAALFVGVKSTMAESEVVVIPLEGDGAGQVKVVALTDIGQEKLEMSRSALKEKIRKAVKSIAEHVDSFWATRTDIFVRGTAEAGAIVAVARELPGEPASVAYDVGIYIRNGVEAKTSRHFADVLALSAPEYTIVHITEPNRVSDNSARRVSAAVERILASR